MTIYDGKRWSSWPAQPLVQAQSRHSHRKPGVCFGQKTHIEIFEILRLKKLILHFLCWAFRRLAVHAFMHGPASPKRSPLVVSAAPWGSQYNDHPVPIRIGA